jgi:hypothetical protein
MVAIDVLSSILPAVVAGTLPPELSELLWSIVTSFLLGRNSSSAALSQERNRSDESRNFLSVDLLQAP